MRQNNTSAGFVLAATAAALFASGCAATAGTGGSAAQEAQVKCAGINACAGKSDCATASSSCKGQNSCKGQGWQYVDSKEECKEQGGTVKGS